MSPAIQTVLQSWVLPVPVTLFLVITALVYLRGWSRLHGLLPNVISVWQLAAFMSGLFALWIAVGSPLAAFDDELLSIHMIQHILLMAVAPPLILLGAPALPLLHGLPQMLRSFRLGSGSALATGAMGGAHTDPPCILLAGCYSHFDWMALSELLLNLRCVRILGMRSNTHASS